MKDVPVYTLGKIVTKTFFGKATSGFEFLQDTAGDVIFWEGQEAAFHVCAEQNAKNDGWWVIVPRMVRSIRDHVDRED